METGSGTITIPGENNPVTSPTNAILNVPLIFGGTSEEDLEHYANVNKMLKHSVGLYDNVEYSTYYANVTENANGTISIDVTDNPNADYIMKTTYNANGTISIDALEVKGEEL